MTDAEMLKVAKALSVMGPKLEHLFTAASRCTSINGEIAEVGVFRGGSAMVLCHVFPWKVVHGFDTYTGIPEDDSEVPDGHKQGDFANTRPSIVMANLAELRSMVK